MPKSNRLILPVLVVSQFFCTSLWFAGNAVIKDLSITFNLEIGALSYLTSAVQFGFIGGTLTFALLTISDRFSPSKVFFICALLGALFNLGILNAGNNLLTLLLLRFLTGFALAGIYPVGMKIAADYYQKGLGQSLGYLVGALVVGTAFPHLIKGLMTLLPWKLILLSTSIFASVGAAMMYLLIPDGPYRKPSLKLDLNAITRIFNNKDFRSAAFGYFGHMWELYAFWTFLPVLLANFLEMNKAQNFNVSLLSFFIIGLGGPACVLSGYLSLCLGAKKTAAAALLLSCICCLLSPLILGMSSTGILLAFCTFWGIVVIADSPLFSTLVANNAIPDSRGTALTLVNCIGFSVTIVSIQLINAMNTLIDVKYIYMFLAIGPIFGLIALHEKKITNP